MPRVPLAGLSSRACEGTSAAMSKYCFWPSRGWLCCERIKLATIFTSAGSTVLTCKQCVSALDVQLQSGAASEGARTISDLSHLSPGSAFQLSASQTLTLMHCTYAPADTENENKAAVNLLKMNPESLFLLPLELLAAQWAHSQDQESDK